jgi:hypothetical protein
MPELLAILTPILLTDVLNPVLAATVIFALGTPRPYRATLWVLAGWFAVYFAAGAVLTLGLERLIRLLAEPLPVYFQIQALVAIAMVWLAYRSARDAENPRAARRAGRPARSGHALGAVAGLMLGATINLVSLPDALPYYAALDQVLKAGLDARHTLVVLALYNLAYLLPFAALVLLRLLYRDGAGPLFERLHAGLERVGAVLLPAALFLLGAALLVDAVLYFVAGGPLFDIAPSG